VRLDRARWARFYEIGTNRPIYSGRDGIVRYDISEIEAERRTGYAWSGNWPERLIASEYPRWRARISESTVR
jgi:PelA/Pel-15E family pectate lyase